MNYTGPHTEQVTIPGDIYIPAYTPLQLSADMAQIHRILFGAAPDYLGLVYRTNQYLGILHSTEYSSYMFVQDPRITYDSSNLTIASESVFATMIRGPDGLHVTGTWADAGNTGRTATLWTITIQGDNSIKVVNNTDGLSERYTSAPVKQLVGSDLVFTIDAQAIVPGAYWYVIHTARPQPDVPGVLAQLKSLPTNILASVFGDISKEPYKTFYNLFKSHYAPGYQLTGLLLAFINKLEDQRKHVS